jgi:DNA repair protein RadC
MNLEEKKKWLEDNKELVDNWIENYIAEESEILDKLNEEARKLNRIAHEIAKKLGKDPLPDIKEISKSTEETVKENMIYKNIDEEYINSPEVVQGINISQYLDKIRYDFKKENFLVLYIKNKKIIDEDIFTDNKKSMVNISEYILTIIEKAKQLEADVFDIHNHTFLFSASESKADQDAWKKIEKLAKEEGINVIGHSVVTREDYNQIIIE